MHFCITETQINYIPHRKHIRRPCLFPYVSQTLYDIASQAIDTSNMLTTNRHMIATAIYSYQTRTIAPSKCVVIWLPGHIMSLLHFPNVADIYSLQLTSTFCAYCVYLKLSSPNITSSQLQRYLQYNSSTQSQFLVVRSSRVMPDVCTFAVISPPIVDRSCFLNRATHDFLFTTSEDMFATSAAVELICLI